MHAEKHVVVDPACVHAMQKSWEKIAPSWPLKHLVAMNPLAGFESLPFIEALWETNRHFLRDDLPQSLQSVNRETIKWLQVFFDEGQSTFSLPMRHKGLLRCLLSLLEFDTNIVRDPFVHRWLTLLPSQPEAIIASCLEFLDVSADESEILLTMMLTSLPGWASYIQHKDSERIKQEYLAFRLVLTCFFVSKGSDLLDWYQTRVDSSSLRQWYKSIQASEAAYQHSLRSLLMVSENPYKTRLPDSQWVFCIDVRSEPFRRSLESSGNHETYGFAGFFGLPVSVHHEIKQESHAACPVLLKPQYEVVQESSHKEGTYSLNYRHTHRLKHIYQSMKYTFSAPFSLAESVGMLKGFWMAVRSLSPQTASKIQTQTKKVFQLHDEPSIAADAIPHDKQVDFAETALRMIGLTDNFSPFVFFCGHASKTENNSHAASLDCGACAGHNGAPNAKLLVGMLNNSSVREALNKRGICIPEETVFVAAKHNTTTDEISIYDHALSGSQNEALVSIKKDIETASSENRLFRASALGVAHKKDKLQKAVVARSKDWAQVRPEWGLAKNASFIIAHRDLTRGLDLKGRSFLHSYDWEADADNSVLTAILKGPMVVAHWINSQYLFSTLDNVAFGGGSKVTKNITGKIGAMQGNASDLMHGLPLQSVYENDTEPFHEPLRLSVFIQALPDHVEQVISGDEYLSQLVRNEWVHVFVLHPETRACEKLSL